VRGVIVDDQMHFALGRGLAVDLVEEADELLMPVAAHALADDLAVEHVERGEQGRRAVPLMIMGHRAAAAALHRQPRLGAGTIASSTPSAPDFPIAAGGLEDLRKRTPASTEELKSPLERQLSRATSRLYREITDLGRRGNTNLLIGIITTVIGVGILVYVVYCVG
jgi:hypothetical protein